jgi:hypothetical protein
VLVQAEELALRQSVEVQHETDYRGGRGVGTTKTRIRSGLFKLRAPLEALVAV